MNPAHAPYNFVPLPTKVKKAAEPPRADKYHVGRFSGFFACTLTAKTPLYIRSTLSKAEYEAKAKREEAKTPKNLEDDKPAFFQPGGKLAIPGSSLRGMIRTLVEIIGASQFQNYADTQLFYRAVGGRTAQSIVQRYRNRIQLEGNSTVRAGYVEKKGSTYQIYPAIKINGYDFFRILNQVAVSSLRIPPENINKKDRQPQWVRMKVWFLPGLDARRGRPLIYDVKKREATTPPPDSRPWQKGWVIISGHIPKKSKNWVIPDLDTSQHFEIDIEDIQSYQYEGGLTPAITKEGRDESFSVLPDKDGTDEALPCFFVEWQDRKSRKHISFGHTAYFRLPYENTSASIVGTQLPNLAEGEIDLVEAIFGTSADSKKKGYAGRVFFEDATLRAEQPENAGEWNEVVYPKILSSPKPTTFQHYLDQSEALFQSDERERMNRLKFWDAPSAKIRGYKLYWHRTEEDWNITRADMWKGETDVAKKAIKERQYTRMRPIYPGTTFEFRVRFENLSEVELGALATTLQLPAGCAHKLGMAKPLGLGSVEIKADLFLTDRRVRYQRLFSQLVDNTADWHTGTSVQAVSTESYKAAFNNWSGESWEQDGSRLQQLKALLTFDERPKAAHTSYMKIEEDGGVVKLNEYKERPILPYPTEIIGWAKASPQPREVDQPVSTSRVYSTPDSPIEVERENRQKQVLDRLSLKVQEWVNLDSTKVGGKGGLKTEFSKFITDWKKLDDSNPLKLDLAEKMWPQIYNNDLEQEKSWKFYPDVQQIQQLLRRYKRLKR